MLNKCIILVFRPLKYSGVPNFIIFRALKAENSLKIR